MDFKTNLLSEAQDTPADIDTVAQKTEASAEAAAAFVPAGQQEVPETMTAEAGEEAAQAAASAVAEEDAPVQIENGNEKNSFLLDCEISALLGAEVTAILEADWARANGRSVPAKAAPITMQAVKETGSAGTAPVGEVKSAEVEAGKGKKAEPVQASLLEALGEGEKPKKKRSLGRKIFCFVRRTLLLILVVILLLVAAAAMACHTIFNGPSQDAREILYSTFMESSYTKWIPGLFLSEEEIAAIENKQTPLPPAPDISGQITIDTDTTLSAENNEWKDHPDGIDILTEYGAVNVCNLYGGSSSTMFQVAPLEEGE